MEGGGSTRVGSAVLHRSCCRAGPGWHGRKRSDFSSIFLFGGVSPFLLLLLFPNRTRLRSQLLFPPPLHLLLLSYRVRDSAQPTEAKTVPMIDGNSSSAKREGRRRKRRRSARGFWVDVVGRRRNLLAFWVRKVVGGEGREMSTPLPTKKRIPPSLPSIRQSACLPPS